MQWQQVDSVAGGNGPQLDATTKPWSKIKSNQRRYYKNYDGLKLVSIP